MSDFTQDYSEYFCDYEIKVSFGKYVWCVNAESPSGSGFTLTNSKCIDPFENPYTYMMFLKLKPNDKLLKNADFFDIYTDTGFLFGYNVGSIHSNLNQFKKIEQELIGTELEIIFSIKKNLTDEEKEIITKRFIRMPREEIFTIKIKIPELMQYGDCEDCAICLGEVNDITNKYISPCGHLFHLKCIFQYLESKNLLYPMFDLCDDRCCGANKIKPFECVVCKTIISK